VTAAVTYQPGTLVRARGREWVVLAESAPDLLVLRPLGGADDERTAVLPDIEPVSLATFPPPDPADAGNATRAGMLRTALRIGFRATGGPFRCLAGIAVEPRPYQLVPLLMALRQDVVRLLVADDVGVGKTIEAGLIAAELIAQGDADGLAVLCGPALAEQWQGELAGKFGVHAELVLPGTVRRLERTLLQTETLFDRYRHVVVSTDYIKRPELRDQFLRGCPNLVIVDEAHTCVVDDTQRAGRSRMLRHELVRRIAERADRHLLLVTATPHSGKDEGFRNLLSLLDPTLSTVDLEHAEGRQRLARHFVQRRRADIRAFLEDTPFPEDRQRKEQSYQLSSEYRQLFDDVYAYARQTVRDYAGGGVRQRVRYWSALALLRAMASSPMAAAATLRTRAANADAADPAEADALGRAGVLDLPDDETYESIDLAPGADTEADAGGGPQRRKLLEFARRAEKLAVVGDAKLDLLVREVKALLSDGFNPVVFCRFIDTAEYVAAWLTSALARTAEVGCVTGALPPEERAARIAELTAAASGRTRPVLVATDCLSEGVNLQEHFQAVVHYDLAWNPTRHEQREGRVDRFGQRAPKVRAVTIYGLDNRIDEIVLRVLLRKHEQIHKALGVAVPVPDRGDDVLATIAQELLMAPQQAEQLVLEGLVTEASSDLHAEWDSAAAKEKESRTRYAQRGIQPAEVAAELAEIRASLGSPDEVAEFASHALAALGAEPRETGFGYTAAVSALPLAVRDRFPPSTPDTLDLYRELPVPPRAAHLDRTDPHVAALARYLLESALDPTLPPDQRPARRAGVMRTTAVAKRTTLVLVRVRLHVTLPSTVEPRPAVAEEATLLAFRGAPGAADWLAPDEVDALARATPTGNVAPDQARELLARTIAGLDAVAADLSESADELAERLRAAHIRVREAAGQRVRRSIEVVAQKPADILGVYVYLPEVAG
jgi:superfamily II DNA or RNA helicase